MAAIRLWRLQYVRKSIDYEWAHINPRFNFYSQIDGYAKSKSVTITEMKHKSAC